MFRCSTGSIWEKEISQPFRSAVQVLYSDVQFLNIWTPVQHTFFDHKSFERKVPSNPSTRPFHQFWEEKEASHLFFAVRLPSNEVQKRTDGRMDGTFFSVFKFFDTKCCPCCPDVRIAFFERRNGTKYIEVMSICCPVVSEIRTSGHPDSTIFLILFIGRMIDVWRSICDWS